jgi:hypothetical protein
LGEKAGHKAAKEGLKKSKSLRTQTEAERMTTVINLFAGPGAGKSTTAAEIFWRMKRHGLSCELVREYVKDWAYEDRAISKFDQFYIVGKQIKKESLLYDKVDFVITDCPIWNSAFYERHLEGTTYMVNHVRGFTEYAQSKGIKYHNYLLTRQVAYQEDGRYQTEDEALEVDARMKEFLLDMNLPFKTLEGKPDDWARYIIEQQSYDK